MFAILFCRCVKDANWIAWRSIVYILSEIYKIQNNQNGRSGILLHYILVLEGGCWNSVSFFFSFFLFNMFVWLSCKKKSGHVVVSMTCHSGSFKTGSFEWRNGRWASRVTLFWRPSICSQTCASVRFLITRLTLIGQYDAIAPGEEPNCTLKEIGIA